MSLQTMYPGMNNSPKTTLTASITASATSMTVGDASLLPEAPNIAVIGSNAQAEVVIYGGKNGNILTNLIRGSGGTSARSWSEDTVVARNFTMLDYKNICDNITELDTSKRNVTDPINVENDVTGVLDVPNGGTGRTSLTDVRSWLQLAALAYKAVIDLASTDVSGVLPKEKGGTGLQATPSMKVNLGSTAAADVFVASPQPGVSGILPVNNGGTGANSVSVNRVFAGPGTGSTAGNPSFRALVAADIPGISATKITSDTLDAARIPGLNASKINAGTLDAARIPGLNASKINAGTLDAARIPGISATKITSDTLDAARIPTLTISKISNVTAIAQRPNYVISNSAPGNTLVNGTIHFVI